MIFALYVMITVIYVYQQKHTCINCVQELANLREPLIPRNIK